MTLEQLRIFIAVAEREHVTRAAEALNLTQSAVSSAIAALEQRHAAVLFHRIGRGIELTAAGRLFLEEARAVLDRAEAAERMLADLSGLERGSLAIYASQTIANYWLPPRLVRFRKAHPKIGVALYAVNTAQVVSAVRDGIADLGFAEGVVDHEDLVQQTIARDRLVIVTAATDPWTSAHALTPRVLCEADWIIREKGSGTRSEFEDALKKHGITTNDLNIVLEVPSNEAARLAVEEGAGATAISELAARPGLISGRLGIASFDLPERGFIALRHRERHLSRAAGALLDFLKAGAGLTGKQQAPTKARASAPSRNRERDDGGDEPEAIRVEYDRSAGRRVRFGVRRARGWCRHFTVRQWRAATRALSRQASAAAADCAATAT